MWQSVFDPSTLPSSPNNWPYSIIRRRRQTRYRRVGAFPRHLDARGRLVSRGGEGQRDAVQHGRLAGPRVSQEAVVGVHEPAVQGSRQVVTVNIRHAVSAQQMQVRGSDGVELNQGPPAHVTDHLIKRRH